MAQQLCWHSTFTIDYYFHFFKKFFWVIFLISLISLINWSSNIKLLSYLLIFVITFWEHFLTLPSIFFNVTLALSNWNTLTFCYSFIYFQLISRKVKIGSISWSSIYHAVIPHTFMYFSTKEGEYILSNLWQFQDYKISTYT